MQVLEKPEGSTKGISYLTTRNVYVWRKKPYQLGDGVSVKRWERRPRLVAREFAFDEGKRDDIFSPATSGHVLKLLPTIFLQGIKSEQETLSTSMKSFLQRSKANLAPAWARLRGLVTISIS